MRKLSKEDLFISDSGVIASKKRLHISIFVIICRILTIILAILGGLAFYTGTFR